MTNRPLYVRKYHSSRLKEFDYEINNTFDESKELNEIIGLTDSQILRTIRDITGQEIDKEKLEELILKQNKIKFIEDKQEEYIDLRNESNKMRFIEEYVVVVMDNLVQYDYLYKNGFKINGEIYKRLSCSAGQARVSTVIFCKEDILEQVEDRLENGRDKTHKFSPSKFNAYFGLYGSSTHLVTEPRFIIIKDYENEDTFECNFVEEQEDWNKDDIITKKTRTEKMNRTDGMGLISPKMAEQWSKDIGLYYIPSQFCVRQSFIKGMLCVFDFHLFCEEKNNGNYIVDTIYKDENGEYIKADLRDYDVILSESQAKLYDSYTSIEQYLENCYKNNLKWGVALYSPKEAKHMIKLNYQFIQTLNLNKNGIEELCSQFVEWIEGVSYKDRYYMLLFLLGVNNDEEKIRNFLSSSENYWIKCLILCDELKNDKYIRTKIRELIKKKIENACKGDIYVDGNFQVIVSDPYGFMQHTCGLEVTGLLGKDEFYSNYWNNLGIKKVDAMRSPLTYMSEHVVLNLVKNEETEKWYKYCKLGIILNYHGHETVNFAGSDFDMDILATTSNKTMIDSIYKDEMPIVYDAPKPNKIVFTKDDLYKSDTFSFGSIIGGITNKSSNGYALLSLLEEKYGKDSEEYKITKLRLKYCCKAQSAQIDKAKIGREVKGIPSIWIEKNKEEIDENGNVIKELTEDEKLYNRILLNRYPYFFRYVYKDTNKKYKQYLEEYNMTCQQKYKISFEELLLEKRKTKEQSEFIDNFYEYCPVIISDSSMNLLCKYIESINFNISQKTKIEGDLKVFENYKDNSIEYLDSYIIVEKEMKKFKKNKVSEITCYSDSKDEVAIENKDCLYDFLGKLKISQKVILNCLIDYYYINNPKGGKDMLWKSYGKLIFENIKKNFGKKEILFPFPSKDDEVVDINYLGYNYSLRRVELK